MFRWDEDENTVERVTVQDAIMTSSPRASAKNKRTPGRVNWLIRVEQFFLQLSIQAGDCSYDFFMVLPD